MENGHTRLTEEHRVSFMIIRKYERMVQTQALCEKGENGVDKRLDSVYFHIG
jgi:hypothetical protein